ncbi:MAG TPA: NUDIX hydrolase [Treponema sp.]|nr:MAG: NUDIX hydrolase [Treponema sp. GWA1_62_8]OHE64468.1 MAG: NUDIX hydrolase [Treponema sp. GWC1_61_84]OHE75499.1 MAG: NUDIX hydrolase [Treponema sp. RIFOXYC1_FULL_61_9]HCM26696.1 NUDIX hydrolase [Treponema sp.]
MKDKQTNDAHLRWEEISSSEAYRCRVFSVRDSRSRSPDGRESSFTIIDAPDWAIVIPLVKTEVGESFLMVRQWRHGEGNMSLEFPGGVIEEGEEPGKAAERELIEETGWKAETIEPLGSFNPNPAIMSNRVHVFLAMGTMRSGEQELDDDEYVDFELVPKKAVLAGMGRAPYVHALMASALVLYLRLGGSGE